MLIVADAPSIAPDAPSLAFDKFNLSVAGIFVSAGPASVPVPNSIWYRWSAALAGTVEGWRSLSNRSSRYCGEHPNFRCAPFLAANRRGNPNLSGTVCRTALACVGRRSHVRISGGTEWAASSLAPQPRLGVAHVPRQDDGRARTIGANASPP
jgi:hypothetical protein